MRVDHARDLIAHGFHFGRIDANSSTAVARRQIEDVEYAPGAGDDYRQTGRIRLPGCTGGRQMLACTAVEKLEIACNRIRAVAGFDRVRIGGVHPREHALRVPCPNRRRQCFDQGAQRIDVAE